MSAMYFPTSYRKVVTISSDPMGDEQAVPFIIEEGLPNHPAGTYYKVDLRNIQDKNQNDQTAEDKD